MSDLKKICGYRRLDGKEKGVKDYFGRETFSATTYSLIQSGRLGNSYVLGISGGWGTGKTWVLETLCDALEKDGEHLCVWFNAWQYESREALFFPVVQLILEKGLEVIPEQERTQFTKNITQLKSMIVGSSQWVPILAGLATPLGGGVLRVLFGWLDICRGEERMDRWVSNVEKISEEFSEVISNINKHNKTVVIFIDDLDRCSPESVIKMLEQLKHLIHGKSESKVVFIIGIDDKAVKNAIKTRYGEMFTSAEADSYLEKVVTFRLDIPEINKKQFEAVLGEQFQELGMQGLPLSLLSSALVSGRMHNIRKLYLAIKNYHVIEMAYCANKTFLNQRDKVFIFCLIKEFWPHVYEAVLTASNHVFVELLNISSQPVGTRREMLRRNAAAWHEIVEKYIGDNSLFGFLNILRGQFPGLAIDSDVNLILRFCLLMEPVEG